MTDDTYLLDVRFSGEVVEWRGPAPYYFVAVPAALIGEVAYAARQASYGWGVVPVTARIGEVDFTTSLFPRDGGYLVPLKAAVRKAAGITTGDRPSLTLRIMTRD